MCPIRISQSWGDAVLESMGFRLAKPNVSLEMSALLTLDSYSPLKEEMIAGFYYGTWNKLSTPELSPYS